MRRNVGILFVFTAFLFLFTGCENFLQGQDVKDEILSAIEYNNAPAYRIRVEAKSDDVGTIRTPATHEVNKKVTDSFTIKFDPKSDYTFIMWEAVISALKAGETADDYIVFEDPYSLETKVTFKKAASDILIQPVCPEKLTVSINVSDAGTVYPRDKTIELTFNKPVAAECKDKVSIRIPDIPENHVAKDYFKPAQIDDNILSIFAAVTDEDSSMLIPVETSGKIISVMLGADDFYYINNEYSQPEKVYLENDVLFTYSISKETSSKTKIRYELGDNVASHGLFRVDGVDQEGHELEYSVQKEINLRYTLNDSETYAFKGWSFGYKPNQNDDFETVAIQNIHQELNLKISYPENEDTLGYDSVSHVAQAVVTIYNYKEGFISITPVVSEIPKTTVKILGSNGSFSSVQGEQSLRQGQSVSLVFEANSDYAFTRWKIYDAKNPQTEIPNGTYLTIASPRSGRTDFTLTTALEESSAVELCLEAVTVKRPRIISHAPQDKEEGVHSDSRIQIMFDTPMSPKSIYFDSKPDGEIDQLKRKYGLADSDFLWSGTNCYAYIKDNQTYFKNISIVDYAHDTSIANLFACPEFETPKTLVINILDRTKIPAIGTTVIVTIASDMFYEEDESCSVTLKEAYIWPYLVDGKIDEVDPYFSNPPVIKQAKTAENAFSSTADGAQKLTSSKIYMKIESGDADSGPNSNFALIVTKVGTSIEKPYSVSGVTLPGKLAEFAGDYEDLKELFDYETHQYDGTYSICVKIFDKSGRHTTSSLQYFIVDTTPPLIASHTLSISDDTNNSEKTAIDFTYTCNDADYTGGKFYYRPAVALDDTEWNDWTNLIENTISSGTNTISGLNYATTYEIKAEFYDDVNNTTTCYFKKNTKPVPITAAMIQTPVIEEVSRAIRVPVSIPTTGGVIPVLRCGSTPEIQKFEGGTNTFLYRDVDYGKSYSFKVAALDKEKIVGDKYDNNGIEYDNYSNEVSLSTVYTKPKGVTSVTVSYRTVNKINFEISKPTGITGVKVSWAQYNDDGSLGAYSSETTSAPTYQKQNLTPGARYNFKFETYYNTENNLCCEEKVVYVDVSPKPEPVTNLQIVTGDAGAALTWTPPANNTYFTHYLVRVKKDLNNDVANEIKVDKDAPGCAIGGLSSEDWYYFSVYTMNETDASDEVSKQAHIKKSTESSSTWVTSDDFEIKNITSSGFKISSTTTTTLDTTLSLHYATTYNRIYTSTVAVGTLKFKGSSGFTLTTNSLTVQDLQAGTLYYFVFKNGSSSASTICSDVIPVWIPPSASPNQYATLPEVYERSSTSIYLSWTNPTASNPSQIEILYKKSALDNISSNWISYKTITASSGKNYQNVTGLEPNTWYDFKISCIKSSMKYTTCFAACTDYEPVNRVDSFTYNDRGPDYITLAWEPNGTCEYYEVWNTRRMLGMTNDILVAKVPYGINSITITGLSPCTSNTVENYRIKTVGNNQTTGAKYCSAEKITTTLQSVTDLKVSNITDNFVYLSWTPADSHPSGHVIQYRPSDYDFWFMSSNGAPLSSSSVSISEDFKGKKIFFNVKTRADSTAPSDKPESPGVMVSTYMKPSAVTVSKTQSSRTGISVQWTNPTKGIYSKTILQYKKSSSSEWIDVLTVNYSDFSKRTSYAINYLLPDTNYDFRWVTYADIEKKVYSTATTIIKTAAQ